MKVKRRIATVGVAFLVGLGLAASRASAEPADAMGRYRLLATQFTQLRDEGVKTLSP